MKKNQHALKHELGAPVSYIQWLVVSTYGFIHAQDLILVTSISVYLCDHSNPRESGLEPLLSAIG